MTLEILPVAGLGEVRPGDDLAELIAAAADLRDGDVVVVAQKIVSKAEGAVVAVPAGQDRAVVRARVAREQAVRVLAEAPWTIIVETPQGLVCANAGIDASNVEPGLLTLLPADPDASARGLRAGLRERAGVDVAVVVTDTFGRPWRLGLTDVAIGLAGFAPIRDDRGRPDRFGMTLEVTEVAIADELAAAADLVREGKADGVPVVVVRGLDWAPDEQGRAAHLQRPSATDLFPRGRGALADLLAAPPAPEPGGRTPSDHDWQRVLSAVRAAGDGRVAAERQGAVLRLQAHGEGAAELVALGAAAATARAALADLGWASAVQAEPGPRLVLWTAEPASDRRR